ncbi:MAG: HAD-IIIA family hydrolase [Vampirovibrionales bacterium]|nr:HAD-IIIA family hydrolase [Vampirovibrionales bacterium]
MAMDIDGVLTDGRIVYADNGAEFKAFNVKDGQGLALLKRAGVRSAFITARSSSVNARRAEELGIDVLGQDIKRKWPYLQTLLAQWGLSAEEVAYLGDDWPDADCLRRVGLACCPADAASEIQGMCHVICAKPGGGGAAREITDLILRAQGAFPAV